MPITTDQQALTQECIQLWRSGLKTRTITSAGLSMYPLIPDGSILTFVPRDADRSIVFGDIVLFERGDMLVAHRVLNSFYKDGSLWFREKGDNKFLPGVFPADCLIGRIVKIEYNDSVHDLTGVQAQRVSRLIAIYYSVLFALLRSLISLKHVTFKTAKIPRLRSFVFKTVRILSTVPTSFFKRQLF